MNRTTQRDRGDLQVRHDEHVNESVTGIAPETPGGLEAPKRGRPVAAHLTVWIVVATVAQLAVATFVHGMPQFEGKAFGSRLAFYPLLMLAPVAIWAAASRRRPDLLPLPWAAFAWVAAPFLVDVTGNTLDLYDSVAWWDDANHLVNWLFLCLGVGLMLQRSEEHTSEL